MSVDHVVLIDHTIRPVRASKLYSVLNPHFEEGTLIHTRTPKETIQKLPSIRGLIARDITEEKLSSAPELEWIQVLSSGTNTMDIEMIQKHGIVLTNSSGIHAEPIAEQVLGYILIFERELYKAFRQQSRGVWERFDGDEVPGSTVGILGVGAIGSRVAEVCSALGMEPIGTKQNLENIPSVLKRCYPATEYHEVITQSDYLVITCPLTPETKRLIGWRELRLLGDGVLINVARGGIVDESALIRALQQRRIRGAALDVFETEPLPKNSPLWELSNVIITPHMAGSTSHKPERWREIIVQNYEAMAAGKPNEYINRVV